jgi:hypothetical protein
LKKIQRGFNPADSGGIFQKRNCGNGAFESPVGSVVGGAGAAALRNLRRGRGIGAGSGSGAGRIDSLAM